MLNIKRYTSHEFSITLCQSKIGKLAKIYFTWSVKMNSQTRFWLVIKKWKTSKILWLRFYKLFIKTMIKSTVNISSYIFWSFQFLSCLVDGENLIRNGRKSLASIFFFLKSHFNYFKTHGPSVRRTYLVFVGGFNIPKRSRLTLCSTIISYLKKKTLQCWLTIPANFLDWSFIVTCQSIIHFVLAGVIIV